MKPKDIPNIMLFSTMFSRACETNVAQQRNWYPSPIAGLYSYQAWNGFVGFWQNGAVLETFANFMDYGNNTRYQVNRNMLLMHFLLLKFAVKTKFVRLLNFSSCPCAFPCRMCS